MTEAPFPSALADAPSAEIIQLPRVPSPIGTELLLLAVSTFATAKNVPVDEEHRSTVFARIGVMRALNSNHVREFNPKRKEPHWGRRKLKKD